MLPRILEPEVMDTLEDALEYDAMDFTEVNTAFAERAVELLPQEGLILDLGTGTARIPLIILELNPKLKIIATDLSINMLDVAKTNVEKSKHKDKITLIQIDAKKIPYPNHFFDGVISNSLIHHIPEPIQVFREINRVAKPSAAIFLRDLFRPDNDLQVKAILEKYAADCNEHQKKLYRDSLLASLTITEVESLIKQADLTGCIVVQSSDRHWSVERKFS
ncbi:MAG: Ubiquinone/menaquinone biosynthesis methyltransferase UbiE [Ignavibacteriae bacterium]|nr:MAG: Ubiquinone/menaquinone biosynthesis methyltransferase UbiE [Ignavibacteriota bacterium]